MVLHGGIVVGNVDHRLKLDTLQRVCQDLLDAQHHQATVAEGELNAVLHLVPVRTKLLGTLRQERHVDLRRDDRVPFLVERRSQLVVIVSDLLAEVSLPRVDHDPERALFVHLQLDEVVAATERTDLIANGVLTAFNDLQLIDVEALRQILLVLRLLVVVHTQRNAGTDASHDLLADGLGREILHLPVGLNRAHSAADIHTYGVGHYHTVTGKYTTDRHTHAGMYVGHDGQVMVKEGQRGKVLDLMHCRLLHLVRPDLYRTVVDDLYFHFLSVLILLILGGAFARCLCMSDVSDYECKIRNRLRSLFAQHGVTIQQ